MDAAGTAAPSAARFGRTPSGGRARTQCAAFFEYSTADRACAREEVSSRLLSEQQQQLLAGDGLEEELVIMTLGLKTPANFGSLYRLAACFGVQTIHHVGAWLWADDAGRRAHGIGGMGAHELRTMRATAKGCESLVNTHHWCFQQLVDELDARRTPQHTAPAAVERSPSASARLPIVVLETTEGAVPVQAYRFPPRCILLVGAEGAGVNRRLLQRLVPGFDACVYVPLCGAHKSLNVVEAACCGVYEYRRQWAGTEKKTKTQHLTPPACSGGAVSIDAHSAATGDAGRHRRPLSGMVRAHRDVGGARTTLWVSLVGAAALGLAWTARPALIQRILARAGDVMRLRSSTR